MKKITSKNHKIYTQDTNKISLSSFDDKRHFKDDGINTLAFGHKDIPKNDLKKIFFSLYIIMASADIFNQSLYPNSTKDTIKYSVYPGSFSAYEYIKNNHILEDFSNLVNIIYNIRNKKIKDFAKIYQIAVDHTYKMDDPLLIRHFLLETVEEINNDLIKNNKTYRVDFRYNMLSHFLNEDDAY